MDNTAKKLAEKGYALDASPFNFGFIDNNPVYVDFQDESSIKKTSNPWKNNYLNLKTGLDYLFDTNKKCKQEWQRMLEIWKNRA